MKIIYGIIIILLIILLGACALKAKNKKGNLARIVFLYETGAVLFGITFMIFTFSNNITIIDRTFRAGAPRRPQYRRNCQEVAYVGSAHSGAAPAAHGDHCGHRLHGGLSQPGV